MKKYLIAAIALAALTGSATAADLTRMAYKGPPPTPVFSWTGIYVGVHVGAGWGYKEWEQTIPVPTGGFDFPTAFRVPGNGTGGRTLTLKSADTVHGLLGGVQTGFNIQTGWVVWGGEFQYSWSDVKGTGSSCGYVALWNCNVKVSSLWTLAGRLGVTYDHTLVYVKAGWAGAHDTYDNDFLGLLSASASDTRWGWMVGTGVELAVTRNWSAKIEYDYMDLGSKSYVFPTVADDAGRRLFDNWAIAQRMHLIKFGLNYRLDWGTGIIAAY